MNLMNFEQKVIFWDWNGTLVDDLDLVLDLTNRRLREFSLEVIDIEFYRQNFGFPISNYYKKIGLPSEGEAFFRLCDAFHRDYLARVEETSIFPFMQSILEDWFKEGKTQFVVSALEQKALDTMVQRLGVNHFFRGVYGLNNRLAVSKVARALEVARKYSLSGSDILYIGDTDHDLEVAEALGCAFLMVSHGHQAQNRLTGKGVTIFNFQSS